MARKNQSTKVSPVSILPSVVTTEPVVSVAPEETPKSFKLIPLKTVNVSSVMPVRWCVPQDILDKVIEDKIVAPHVFITYGVCHDGRNLNTEHRVLVPLTDAMANIEFFEPGPHQIFAQVVWAKKNKEDEPDSLRRQHQELWWLIEQRYDENSKRFRFAYNPEMRTRQGDHLFRKDRDAWSLFATQGFYEEFQIVDLGFFAKKPNAHWWAFVNRYYAIPPRDQCDFRRRVVPALAGVLFDAVWIPLWWVACLATALLCVSLGRRCSLRHMGRPFSASFFSDTLVEAAGSNSDDDCNCFTQTKAVKQPDGTVKYVPRQWKMFWRFATITGVLTSWVVGTFLQGCTKLVFGVPAIKLFNPSASVIALQTLVGMACLILLKLILYFESQQTEENKEKHRANRRAREEATKQRTAAKEQAAYLAQVNRQIAPLVCVGTAADCAPKVKAGEAGVLVRTNAMVHAIPASHRTAATYFLALKANVCRPFARGG